ncbi:hypothetical protein [Herbiconiux sp. L3-i23]|uniref:hypothetical protein n=1 Tax=Herbiconiux sp. L3-i23 TaxID=2905871 RepID=UPI00206636D7|nr:hypothetical protein [Herbiconiux sp. L3-i23]BDI23533.1 hypothetical protein L3i23_23090 [Herbiconiux sp. L3-i23]
MSDNNSVETTGGDAGSGTPTPKSSDRVFPRWLSLGSFVLNGVLFLALVGVGIPVLAMMSAQAEEAASAKASEQAAIAAAEERKRDLFRDAARSCDLSLDDGVEVLAGGAGLDVNGAAGFFGGGATFADQECLLKELGAPATVASRMQGTRALDGTQEASWGDLIIRWTYHPDDGLDSVTEFSN